MTTPPNFKKGVGRLATDRYDFEAHLNGTNPPGFTNFRHDASEVDMNPPVISGATTVQDSLNNVATFIAAQSGLGQGFITVGDGYDTWHAANGNINYDPTIPSLDKFLNPIFAPMLANTVPVAGFERIFRGGVVVIKAGTYIIQDTITIPPGITIMGEGFGTKLINATNLTISPLPPTPKSIITVTAATNASPINITTNTAVPGLVTGDVLNIIGVLGNTAANGTWTVTVTGPTSFSLQGSAGNGTYTTGGSVNTTKPLFRVAADNLRFLTDASVDPNLFMFARETKILNLSIADNFIENTILGDVYFKSAQNYRGQVPLLEQMAGSHLTLDNVSFLGRYNSASIVTEHAIKLNSTLGDPGTILNVRRCFMDGFKIPIYFPTAAGCLSFLEVSNSKIRAYGNINGDSLNAQNNCVIFMNDNNANIVNNYFYSNSANVFNLVHVGALTGGSIPEQSYAKIMVANNQICVDRGASGTGYTYNYLNCDDGSFSNKVTASVIGNIFEQSSSWSVAIQNGGTLPQLKVNKDTIDVNVPFGGPVDMNNTLTVQSLAVFVGGVTSTGVSNFFQPTTMNSDFSVGGAQYITPVLFSGFHTLISNDYILLADTRVGPATVVIPTGTIGRTIIIKDRYGTFGLFPLIIQRSNVYQSIDDYVGDKIIASNWAAITLYCDGVNWLIL